MVPGAAGVRPHAMTRSSFHTHGTHGLRVVALRAHCGRDATPRSRRTLYQFLMRCFFAVFLALGRGCDELQASCYA